MTVTEVAIFLGLRYSKARDRMLAGRLGQPEYTGRTLTVPRKDVEAFKARRTESGE